MKRTTLLDVTYLSSASFSSGVKAPVPPGAPPILDLQANFRGRAGVEDRNSEAGRRREGKGRGRVAGKRAEGEGEGGREAMVGKP